MGETCSTENQQKRILLPKFFFRRPVSILKALIAIIQKLEYETLFEDRLFHSSEVSDAQRKITKEHLQLRKLHMDALDREERLPDLFSIVSSSCNNNNIPQHV